MREAPIGARDYSLLVILRLLVPRSVDHADAGVPLQLGAMFEHK